MSDQDFILVDEEEKESTGADEVDKEEKKDHLAVKKEDWDYPLIELEGKTIGIIGFGRIGQAEGRIARAMGMHVLAYDVYPNDAGRAIGAYVDLDTLLAQSDVVSLHCNLTPENTGLINKENIAKMKDGAILINNARGQLIVEQFISFIVVIHSCECRTPRCCPARRTPFQISSAESR